MAVDQYLTLGSGFKGLQLICDKIFNIKLTQVPLKEGESWHSSVRKIEFTHEQEGYLGEIYFDLISREGKVI